MPKKGRKKPPRKPKPYLWGLLLVAMLGLQGCAALDWVTGAKSETIVDANNDGVPDDAPASGVVETLKNTGPVGVAVAVLVAFATGRYVAKRRKDVVS